ncbi:MAG: Smr/MutS family protein [Deltaproteobacteria bacterium]|nr:Smr/MutS family protein [Deltaproteobacteria bacterium]
MGKKKKKDVFNPAFQEIRLKKETEPAPPSEPVIQPKEAEPGELDDMGYFKEIMSDVVPLQGADRKETRDHEKNSRPAHPAPDPDQEAMNHLRNLVKGSIDIDIMFSDEYIEGSLSGVSRKIMRRLKRGKIPVQDHIDLHGLTKQEAEQEVRDFLVNSHRLGRRCVLIVHGRGLNSPDSFPVLKERLPVWLNRGPARRIVLAFATARPYDGGTGAIYVLLRRR